MTIRFTNRIRDASQRNRSRLVLALDLTDPKPSVLLRRALTILQGTANSLCAIKLNHHLLLPLDLFGSVKDIVDEAHHLGLQVLADLKLGDIGQTNLVASNYLWDVGFDAITANPFVGYEEGLGPLITQAHEAARGVILLVYMSHRGAREGFGLRVTPPGDRRKSISMHELFLQRALSWACDGIIVGATHPDLLRSIAGQVRGKLLIFSPGVGAQGGSAGEAVRAGSDFLIVGRSILDASDPGGAAEDIRRASWSPSST